MLCQNCHKNPATIHLFANVNGHRQEIDLCQDCYQLLRQEGKLNFMNSIPGSNDPFGFDGIDNLFRAMNQQAQRRNANNPNSQPGGPTNNGGNNRRNGGGLLSQFGINITDLARKGKIDPVIGRDKEINRVIEILNRRTKNNPVLIGEAGVGKTAVVEGLAQKIADGDVPAKLQNRQVIRLDVVSLVQGTGVRGQFEQRMQQLMNELKANPNIILFIDEIHEIVGAGNAEGSMDAGNVLKPALARGELQLVGATTLNEYRQIEKDAALARRLQPVQVNEPSVDETIQILKGIEKKYADYHHVHYTHDAIIAAAKLSARYINDRFLPDKAIDLIDEAGSKKNLTIHVVDPKTLDDKIHEAENEKQAALKQEDYEKAAFYRDQVNKFTKMKEDNERNAQENIPTVTEDDIEKIVEEKTGIPVGELKEKEQTQLKNLATDLKKHVIGQDEAVDKVAQAIRRNRVGFNKNGRPIGSFLFVGPTGVGKTELAKQLAKELFGSEEAMIRFDMSEYMEKFSVSKLIGSPPGYVGYEEAGQLTEQVRRRPYSLILLDEIEKAHPDVMNMFLQILDDGRLTDSQGRTVSFKDTIIIMTSNAGVGTEASVGFGAAAEGKTHSVINKLDDYFKPEFLNRFDDIVEFKPLSQDSLMKIVNLMLTETNQTIADQDLSVHVTEPVKEKLVKLGYNPAMGARPLRRVIQEQIEDRVANYYLDHPDVKKLEARIADGEINVTALKEKTTDKED